MKTRGWVLVSAGALATVWVIVLFLIRLNTLDRLTELPFEVAEALLRGDVSEATSVLSTDFHASGWDRATVVAGLGGFFSRGEWKPFVADVSIEPAPRDSEYSVTVIGVLVRGDKLGGDLKRWRVFRVEAQARPRGNEWEFYEGSLVGH